MEFQLESSRCLLARTPETLRTWLSSLPEPWIQQSEGPDTWNPFDIIGHVAQAARVMAKCYSTEVGPWSAYLPILGG